jgi:hypothetical protein
LRARFLSCAPRGALLGSGVTGYNLTCGYPDANANWFFAGSLALVVEVCEQRQHFQGCRHGTGGTILEWQRCAEQGHQPIADHLVNNTPMASDCVKH